MLTIVIKKTIRLLILLLLALIVGTGLNSVYNAWYLDYLTFAGEKKRILERSKGLSLDAETYDERLALARLGNNKLNGEFYRLDDHIHLAEINRINGDSPQKDFFTEIDLNFLNPSFIPLATGNGADVISSGILSYTNSEDNILASTIPLEISLEELGSVNIRVKLVRSKRLYFGWTSDEFATWKDKNKVHYIKVFTIPGPSFQDYRIDSAALTAEQKDIAEPIRKIFLIPEAQESVEIAHIRFDARMKKYIDQGAGTVYEKINDETRKSLFVETGHAIDFEIDIPDDRPLFKFGVSTVNPSPVRISMLLRTKGRDSVLLDKTISGPLLWKDHWIDLISYAGKRGQLTIRSESDIPNAVLISSPFLTSPPSKSFNAVLVVEDSLRADHLSCYGYDRATSPVKDLWAKDGVLFSRAFSQASFTRASCASFLTSLYPGATGVWTPFDVLDDSYTTLAEILRQQGFATLLISQIVNVSSDSGLHQGFDRIIDFRTVGDRASGVYGSDVLDQWFSSHADQNKFVYLHIFDPHHPYDPPETFGAEYHGKPYIGGDQPVAHSGYFDPPWLKHPTVESRSFLYDEEIRYNDELFQMFFEMLKHNKIYDDTLVVFTSDHGEFLGEHHLWGHMPPNHRQVLHVPMIMVYPAEFSKATTIRQPVQLLDIMPTILDMADIPTDDLLLQGDSLLPLIRNDGDASSWNRRLCISDEVQNSPKDGRQAHQTIVYKDFHILHSNAIHDPLHYLMRNIPSCIYETFFKARLYHMGNDPDEYRAHLNFFIDGFFNFKIRQFAGRLRRANLDIYENMAGESMGSATIDAEVLEQLKSLGYVN